MSTIVCYDPQGYPVPVAAATLTFSPAAYAVFIENNEILLLHNEQTGWLTWPGTMLPAGERPYHAVSRVYHLLTGIVPVVGPLLSMEDLYQIDGNGRAWHLTAMFYWLERPSATSFSLTTIDTNLQPQMLPVDYVQRSQLQFGYQVLQAGIRHSNRLNTA